MARLVIVSRSMALAMRLADQHEVVEHPAEAIDGLQPDPGTDVLVLDLGDPVRAVEAVNTLREAGSGVPVLLVSGYQPEWEQVESQQVDGVCVVPLPITRSALLDGVAQLLEEAGDGSAGEPTGQLDAVVSVRSPRTSRPATPPAPPPPAPVPAGGVPGALPEDPAGALQDGARQVDTDRVNAATPAGDGAPLDAPEPDPEPGEPLEAPLPLEPPAPLERPGALEPPAAPPWEQVVAPGARPSATGWFRGRKDGAAAVPGPGSLPLTPGTGGITIGSGPPPLLGDRPRKLRRPLPLGPTTPAGMGLVTDPLGPRTDAYGLPSSLERRLDEEAGALIDEAAVRDAHGVALRTPDLVRALIETAASLYGVSDTAQVLADDVIEKADADAAAVLVPDGPSWRVSGGVGLRPLERRLVLAESHWLIAEIGLGGRAVMIDDTDIVRQQLAGAPLAAWRHLLAVPIPHVQGIAVLARAQEAGPFTDRDLSVVIAPVREAAPLLQQAVEIRRLARLLGPLREMDGEPARRGDS